MPTPVQKGFLTWSKPAGAALLAVLGLALVWFPIGDGLARLSYDLPFLFLTRERPNDVVLVYLDDESHAKLHQNFNQPWDRRLHSQLISKLTREGATLLVFDFVFSDSEPADAALAEAMRAHGRVVLAAANDRPVGAPQPVVREPTPALKQAAAAWGLAVFERDDAFHGVRKLSTGTSNTPALTWEAARLLGAPVTQRPDERLAPRWLNFHGPPGSFAAVSYHQALGGEGLPDGFFKNKFVFIGSRLSVGFASAGKDEFATPYSRFGQHGLATGIELHATAFQNLLYTDWLVRAPRWLESLLAVIIGALAGWGFSTFRPVRAGLFALAVFALFAVLAVVLMAWLHCWFGWLIIAGVVVPAGLTWSNGCSALREQFEKAVLAESVGRHLSPARVRQLLTQPQLLKPGATQQTVSILFSDIAGFSKIAERLHPDDLVRLLNNYYEAAIACIHAEDGTVMDLIGDAIFAIWNAPYPQADHAERACRAALRLHEQLVYFDATQRNLPLRTRVGLHTGPVCVGNIGSSTRFDYTAIGDNVNLASRLEGLNKFLGTHILATREVQRHVEDRLVSRLAGHFKFKGFDKVVEVYELIPTAEKEPSAAWRESFARGLHQFQRKAFDAAELAFRQTLELRPDDGPARFYLDQIAELKQQQLPADWAGEIDLRGK
ncbi:MAG: adenylate/guanylate cyclase domain-containing protein [Verrucomicrobia bacterium]|nr:adenylate/guanylate cyclase domain-containing protein [Verrucomicrobiota bacterium]